MTEVEAEMETLLKVESGRKDRMDRSREVRELGLALVTIAAFAASGYLLGIRGWGRPEPPVYRRLESPDRKVELWLLEIAQQEAAKENGRRHPEAYIVYHEERESRVRFHPRRPHLLEWPGRGQFVLPSRRPVILACAGGRLQSLPLSKVSGALARQEKNAAGEGPLMRLQQRLKALCARP